MPKMLNYLDIVRSGGSRVTRESVVGATVGMSACRVDTFDVVVGLS